MMKFFNLLFFILFLNATYGIENSSNVSKFEISFVQETFREDIIPKVFHQIWFDFGKGLGTTPPLKYQELTERLLEKHPKWTLMEWDLNSVEKLITESYPSFLSTWKGYDVLIKKHDSARYVILHKFGGVFLDHDFITIKNIEPMLGDNNFVIVSEEDKNVVTCNAFIASFKENHFFTYVIQNLINNGNKFHFVYDATGPVFMTGCLREYLKNFQPQKFIILHPKYLYPIHWSDKSFALKLNDINFLVYNFRDSYLIQRYDHGWA